MNKEKRNMNQVAKKEKSDVALTSMFEQDQAGGMDQMGQGDFAMPFFTSARTAKP